MQLNGQRGALTYHELKMTRKNVPVPTWHVMLDPFFIDCKKWLLLVLLLGKDRMLRIGE